MNSLAPMPPAEWKPSWSTAAEFPLLEGKSTKVAFTNMPPPRPKGSGYNSMRTRTRRIRRNIPIEPLLHAIPLKGSKKHISFSPSMNIQNIPSITPNIKANTYYTMAELASMKHEMREQAIKEMEIVLKLYFDSHGILYDDVHYAYGRAIPFYEFYQAYYPAALRWLKSQGNVPPTHWAPKTSINKGRNISANMNALAATTKGTAVPNLLTGKFRRTQRRSRRA